LVWHDAYVPVLIVIVILIILAAVVFVAAGRGGEMPATERSDYAPLDMGPVSATDVVLLRPPTALWGYNQQATDEALERIADSIRERDVRIVSLEQLVTDLSRQSAPPMPVGSPYAPARHARSDAGSTGPDFPIGAEDPAIADSLVGADSATGTDSLARPDSLPGADIGGESQPVVAPATDPLAAPVGERQELPPWQPRAGSPPEVAH
jgi:hypothetical protein